MEAVGFETYCRLLEEAVAELEGRELPSRREVELRLGLELQLPASYIGEPSLRLSFYKRLASVTDDRGLAELRDEVVDRYGPAPRELANLLVAQRVRTAAQRAGVASVVQRGAEWRIQLDPAAPAPAELGEVVGRRPGSRVTSAGEIRLPATAADSLDGVRSLLEELAAARPVA
jgi:transcription-repair coupling factor (superfamily II helicase)